MQENGQSNPEDYPFEIQWDENWAQVQLTEDNNFHCFDGFHHRLLLLRGLHDYRWQSQSVLLKKKHFLESLPKNQRVKLSNYKKHLEAISIRLHHNACYIEKIYHELKDLFREEVVGFASYMDEHFYSMRPPSMEPIEYIFKQLVREWSSEGKDERMACFFPIIDEIKKRFNSSRMDVSKVKILFPGAGLCRLPFEVACHGYDCEAIDCSELMISVAGYILRIPLKKVPGFYCGMICPFVHGYDNVKFNADQLQPVHIPDVIPFAMANLSLRCEDFFGFYRHISEEYECVVTSFFIDCPPNALEVVEAIYRLLKPGGVWINNGPLRYHFNDKDSVASLQLSREDLKEFIIATGFYFEAEMGIPSAYFDCSRSMEQHFYQSWYFVCTKQ